MKKRRLEVIFEDESILVINKPSGLRSIPDRYTPELPHVLSILGHRGQKALLVHRLEKDASGLMLLAKNDDCHRFLSHAFQNDTVHKVYTAIVSGALLTPEVTVDLPLNVNGDRKHRTIVDKTSGRTAVTTFRMVERFRLYSVLEAIPQTDRAHQIRAHLKAIHSPVVCDDLYGDNNPILLSSFKRNYSAGKNEERPLLDRLGLHASSISFPHPKNGDIMNFEAPTPKDFKATINQLRKHAQIDSGNV